jgi:OmpA-OmpF porin, OOP family
MKQILLVALLVAAGPARADILDQAKKAATDQGTKAAKTTANKAVVDKVNKKLLDEGHKNQCAFKTDTAELEPGCNQKLKNLASALIDAKKALAAGGVGGFHFVVSGHTDSTGDAGHNKELSQRRADAIVKEMVARGVPSGEIEAVGMGSEQMLVKPDNTPAKRARNRRYELQVKI